jgi:hypothetical protein
MIYYIEAVSHLPNIKISFTKRQMCLLVKDTIQLLWACVIGFHDDIYGIYPAEGELLELDDII